MKTTSKKNQNLFSIPLTFRGKPFLGLAQLSKILIYLKLLEMVLMDLVHSVNLLHFTSLIFIEREYYAAPPAPPPKFKISG